MPQSSKRKNKRSIIYERLLKAQKRCVDFAIKRNYAAIFAQQRTGKTWMTLAILEQTMNQDLCGVITCLLNNKQSTWVKHLNEYLPDINVSMDWEEFKKLPTPKVFLVHHEELFKWADKIARSKYMNLAICDEAHRAKDRSARFSRALHKLWKIPRRYILTGTPMDKQPRDLWSQFRFLARGVFEDSYDDFDHRYFEWHETDIRKLKFRSEQWKQAIKYNAIKRKKARPRPGAVIKIRQKLKDYAVRITKKEVGIKPPKIHMVPVRMFGVQRQLYDDMRRHSVARYGDHGRAIAQFTMTRIIKERQIASGVFVDDDENVHDIPSAKLRKLKVLVARLSKPIIVFTVWRPETDRIYDMLKAEGYRVAKYYGKTKKKDRPGIQRRFQKGFYDVIVNQIRTGGSGVDLYKANTAIVATLGHSWIDYDQAMSRMDFIFKERDVNIFILTCQNTVDEDIYDMIVEKGLSIDKVLSVLEQRRS